MRQFKVHVQSISYGWCGIDLYINDKLIRYNASYLGPNPLNSLIDACTEFYYAKAKGYSEDYSFTCQEESGSIHFDLQMNKKHSIHFDVIEYDDNEDIKDKKVLHEWHENIPFEAFRKAVVFEGFRVLNAFGLYGFRYSWMDNTDLHWTQLLLLTGQLQLNWNGDSCRTSLVKEIECLSQHIERPKITKAVHYDRCTLYYEAWQFQCCGDPFKVGEKVDWTCTLPSEYKNAHGIIIDFLEDHHGFAKYSITGTVSKIIFERSELPKNDKIVEYEKTPVIQDETDEANELESKQDSDDSTQRIFWGYIVTLEDVVVEPIKEGKK